MKYILKICLIFVLLFGIFGLQASVFAGIGDYINGGSTKVPYCNDGECGLDKGVEGIQDINALETDRKASEYIQSIVSFLLTFISIIAVIYIIYAGFNILTSAGDEEKTKKSKSIIIYVIIGLIVIYLAGPITTFILDVFNNA